MERLCEICQQPASRLLGALQLCSHCYQCYADDQHYSQMHENSIPNSFICQVHSNLAVNYCLCTEGRVYLCEVCLQKHLKTPGVHSLVKVGDAVPDAQSALKYNQKLEACSTILCDLETLKARLDYEEQAAMQYLDQYKQYHLSVIEQTYIDLKVSTQSRYSSLRTLFVSLSSELQDCAQSMVPLLSSSTATFIDSCGHLQDFTLPFFDLPYAISNTITLKISSTENAGDPLIWWLKGWNLTQEKLCVCEKCEKYRELMSLPSQVPWVCIHCRKSNVARKYCDDCGCGKEWVDYLSYNGVRLNESSTRWRCDCGVGNSLTEARCGKCGRENGVIRNGLMARGNAKPMTLIEKLKGFIL